MLGNWMGRGEEQEGRTGARGIAFVALLVAASSILASPSSANLQGISYSLIPSVQHVLWDQDLGLEDAMIYGPRVGVRFGRALTLQGYYLVNPDLSTSLGDIELEGGGESPMIDQNVSLESYGAELVFNLGRGTIVPFVKGGAGVLRFDPDKGPAFEQIGASLGGGIRFRLLDRLTTHIFVEDQMFRLNRSLLGARDNGVPLGLVDPDEHTVRHNLTIGGGVSFILGGYGGEEETALDRAVRSRYEAGIFGASWPVEPFVGTLMFDEAAGLSDQNYAGVRTGMNLGQLVGLRVYYWRGVNDDLDDTSPIQSWGGEAQFNLNSGQGAIPYLLLGAGKLDFLGDYRDEIGSKRDDKAVLLVGGGLGFTLARNLRVNLAARDYVFSDSDPEDLSSPDELMHNWSYSAGLTLILGKRSAGRGEIDAIGRERWQPPPAEVAEGGEPVEVPDVDVAAAGPETAPPAGQIIMAPGTTSGRTITLPVPTVGEIYVRYGESDGITIMRGTHMVSAEKDVEIPSVPDTVGTVGADVETLRSLIREEVGAAVPDAKQPAPAVELDSTVVLSDEGRMELLMRRMEDRLAVRMEEIITGRLNAQAPAPGVQFVPGTAAPGQTVVVAPGGVEQTGTAPGGGTGTKLTGAHTYTGVGVDEPAQWVFGGRLDLGPISGQSPVRFVPEIALGAFGHGSFMAAANAQYQIGTLDVKGATRPYVYGGLGFIRFGKGVERDRTEGVFNIGYGVARNFGTWVGFLEHQGIDLFSLHRLNLGVRWEL